MSKTPEALELNATRRTVIGGAAGLAAATILVGRGSPCLAAGKVEVEMPRPGEICPGIVGTSSPDGSPWDAESLRGVSGAVWVVMPAGAAWPEAALKAAKVLAAEGVPVIQIGEATAPAPVLSLKGPLPFPPSLVLVDAAGFVRAAESLEPGLAQMDRFLLNFKTVPPQAAPNKPAPDFAFKDAGGVWRRVSALRGRRNLLLTFFPKCFTGRCQTHLSSLRDSWGALQDNKTDVWAVSVDAAGGERGQQEFSRFLGLPFPMMPDAGRHICLLYGAVQSPKQISIRQSVLIDRDGIVRWIDLSIQPETHGLDVVTKVRALGLGE